MLIRIGIYPHIAAGSSRHITAFSVGRPVPGPRLPPATTSGRVCRHQCGCGNEGGSSQAGDHRFGQHGSSAEPSIVLENGLSFAIVNRTRRLFHRSRRERAGARLRLFRGGARARPSAAHLLTRTWHLPMQRRAEDCVTVHNRLVRFLSEGQESTNVAREASFDEAKAQHQCSTGVERRRIVIVAGKRSVCRNCQACSGYADAENRNEPRNHSL